MCILVAALVFLSSRLQVWVAWFQESASSRVLWLLQPFQRFCKHPLSAFKPFMMEISEAVSIPCNAVRSTKSKASLLHWASCAAPYLCLSSTQEWERSAAARLVEIAQTTWSSFWVWILVPPLTTYLTLHMVFKPSGFLFSQCKNGLMLNNIII